METRPPKPPAAPPTAAYPFLSPPQAADEIGRLGAFRVLDELGHGGMGVVFRAEEVHLKRLVALKVMLPTAAAHPGAKARFLREAEAQAKVEHDHVIAIHRIDEANGVPFLAMPLLKGQTLSAALRQNRHPPVSEVVRIGREMAEGLAAAHAAGLIHRDIKPANVWLEGNKRRVKILDFGLARVTHEPAADGEPTVGAAPVGGPDEGTQLTAAGAVMGTPAYMSPEQARGQPVDHHTDLFSLGVVLYEMAAGQKPFTGPSGFDVMAAVVSLHPQSPHEVNPDVPPALSELIRRLMAKDAAHRPASAAAVAEELEAIGRGLTVLPVVVVPVGEVPGAPNPWADMADTAPVPAVRPRAPRPQPRGTGPRRLWPAVGLVGAVAAAALVWAAARPRRPPDPTPVPEEAKAVKAPAGTGMPKARPTASPALAAGLRFDRTTRIAFPDFRVGRTSPVTLEAYLTAADEPADPPCTCVYFNNVMNLGWQDGHWHARPGPSGGVSYPAVAGRRTHVAGVFEPDRVRLFVDGKRVASGVLSPHPVEATGNAQFGLGYRFAGVMEEVRVSRGARYDADFAPAARFAPDADTIALYHLDEGAGTEIRDSSGNGRHGTVQNATWVTARK